MNTRWAEFVAEAGMITTVSTMELRAGDMILPPSPLDANPAEATVTYHVESVTEPEGGWCLVTVRGHARAVEPNRQWTVWRERALSDGGQ